VADTPPTDDYYRLEIGQFGSFSVAYRAGTADESVIAHSFDNDIFFKGVPEYVPMPDHVIVDVGAHIGTFTLLAASKAKAGRVYAIEASRETYNFLRINVALNALKNVVTSQVALASGAGKTVLHHDLGTGNWGHSIMKQLSQVGEEVETQTLAGYMDQHGIGRIDFIKCNCEGAEFPIFLTTPNEVFSKIGMMLVLYHCDLVEGYSLDALLSHMEGSGFKIKVFNRTADRGWLLASRD
jgi:FkbM family methyltransferase